MIRLLTFNRLSLLRYSAAHDDLVLAAAGLSARTTSFDCHLVQNPGGTQPFRSLTGHSKLPAQNGATGWRNADVRLISGLSRSTSKFPDGLTVRRQSAAGPGECRESLHRVLTESVSDLQWIHIELPESPAWAPALLQLLADPSVIRNEESFIVTAISGESAEEHSARFESLLWEDHVRIPLWIGGAVGQGDRLSVLTGSMDISATINRRISEPAQTADAATDSAGEAVDLIALCRNPGGAPNRRLRIVHEHGDAIRTEDFFFVRRLEQNNVERTALYVKPDDVWNVHDVSREYPDVAESFRDELASAARSEKVPADAAD